MIALDCLVGLDRRNVLRFLFCPGMSDHLIQINGESERVDDSAVTDENIHTARLEDSFVD